MVIRHPRRFRPLSIAVLALGAAVLVPTVASATPGNPTPAQPQSVASVQRQLGELALNNSQLGEQYDQALIAVAKNEKAAAAAQQAAARANAAFERARIALSAAITAQYEGGTFSATGALLTSKNGASYLDRLNTLSMMSAHTSSVLAGLDATERAAKDAQKQANALLATSKAKRDLLAQRKATLQAQITKYTDLLGTLTAAQRRAYVQAHTPTANVPQQLSPKVYAGGSAAARKAVQFALAQVGKPYVWGAAGPGAYDCSGLTMASWASAGVSLPHSAAEQYNFGTHVPLSALQPGDLIFMYSPIGHVTIYAGNGLMVSAPQSGENVSVIPVSSQADVIIGATRLV